MRRRDFLGVLCGGTAVGLPIGTGAQQPAMPLPTIGLLSTSTALEWNPFVQRLRELGWIEDRNITIQSRWAQGRAELYTEIAAELVRLKVDIIVTSGAGVTAARQASSTIPIVFAMAVDPLSSGLVSSLSRPGGNVTGLSLQQADIVGKRIELLREVVPGFRRLAVMANVGYPAAVYEMRETMALAEMLNMEVTTLEIRQAQDVAPAFDALKERADVVYVVGDPLIFVSRLRINTLALAARLPTIHSRRDYVEAGGLMSYGPNFSDLYRRAAEIADKILRGANAADIPVEQPTKFDLVINLITAKALGLTVPPSLLARADEVIE